MNELNNNTIPLRTTPCRMLSDVGGKMNSIT